MSRLAKYAAPVLAVAGLFATGAPASATAIGGPRLSVTVSQPSAYTGHPVTFSATTTGAPKARVLVQVTSGPNLGKTRVMANDGLGNLSPVSYIGADVPNTGTDQVRFCVDSAPENNVCDAAEVTKTASVTWYAAPRLIFSGATVAFPHNQHVVVSGTLFCDPTSPLTFSSRLNVHWFSAPATDHVFEYLQQGGQINCLSQSNGFSASFATDGAVALDDGTVAGLSVQALDGDAGDTLGVSATRADTPVFTAPQKALSKGTITYFAGSVPTDN